MTGLMDKLLFNAGAEGVGQMEDFVRPLVVNKTSKLSVASAGAGCVIHSFALVWNTISGNLPVDVGQPHMDALIDSLTDHIYEFGFDWSREEIEISVGRTWYEIVQVPGTSGGEKLLNISRYILSYYLDEDQMDMDTATEMVGVIRTIMGGAQVCLEELEVLV
jgi:hypothetical protein